jgi:multidrug efflux pump subunit AcrA (membrane-fusion protein)
MIAVSSLEAIAAEIARLSTSAESWKNVRIVAGACAVVLAVVTLCAQMMEVRRARAIAEMQRELGSLKEAKLQAELAERDVKIGRANLAAARAAERTQELAVDAARAREAQRHVEVDLARQREQTAGAELLTEQLRSQNLEMQDSLTPRALLWSDFVDHRLRAFAGAPCDVRIPPGDIETANFANSLAAVLRKANWKLGNGVTDFTRTFASGVVVSVHAKSELHEQGARGSSR